MRGSRMVTDDPANVEVRRLIDEQPLAWIVSQGSVGFGATLLPMLAECDAADRIVSLLGHFTLSNAQIAQLRAAPEAAILFLGPNQYISPEYVSQPQWGPTWNYASAHFDVHIEFIPEANHEALEKLVDKMERQRRDPWTIQRMGPRYSQLSQRVIAFRAHVRRLRAKFKLAQDESDATLADLLVNVPNPPLVEWMRRHNPGR